jgi:hypothetical protein
MLRCYRSSRQTKGFALVGALILLVIASAAVMAIMSYARAMNDLTTKKITLEQTFYIAESGIHQAIDWFNTPSESPAPTTMQYLIDTYGIDASPFERANVTNFPPTDADLVTLIDNPRGSSSSYGIFAEGHIKLLKVKGPRSGAPANTVFTLYSTGISSDGKTEQTIVADVLLSKFSGIIIPSALVAGLTIGANGQFNLHWGEGWALCDIQVPGKIAGGKFSFNKWFPTVTNDALARITTTGMIYGNDGSVLAPALPPGVPVAPQSVAQSPRLSSYDPNYDNMFQLWDRTTQPTDRLNIPDGEGNYPDPLTDIVNELLSDLEYSIWKDLAVERGQYYRPDSAGEFYDYDGYPLYVDNVTKEITRASETNGTTNARATIKALTLYPKTGTFDDATLPADIIFIDTLDGNTPYNNGGGDTNLCDLTLTGGTNVADYFYTKGVLYICGNLHVGGLGPGSVPTLSLTNPNTGSPEAISIWHNGLVLTEGNFENQGTAAVYGSIVARGSFHGGGSPDIYYNVLLKSGMAFPFASKITILQWGS